MLELIKGASVPNAEQLSEQYQMMNDRICANVSAEKIQSVLENFMDMNQEEALFLFIEVPAPLDEETIISQGAEGVVQTSEGWAYIENPHKDVYYLDNISSDRLKWLLKPFYEILIHDGMSSFGVGNPFYDEVGKYQYNNMIVFSQERLKEYAFLFEDEGISETSHLVTAWDTFTDETPGISELYKDSQGRNVYDVVEELEKSGLYKAEQRDR